jgi:hypothetical protein
VTDSLGINLAGTHVLEVQWKTLAVLHFGLGTQRLDVSLLKLRVLGPDYFAIRVHGHGRFFSTQLNKNATLVIAQSHVVRSLLNRDAPATLQAVVKGALQSERVKVERKLQIETRQNAAIHLQQLLKNFKIFPTPSPVSVNVPNPKGPVFRACQDDGQFRVEGHSGDVLRMTFKSLDTSFVLVVPDFDEPVVGAGDEVRFVATHVVVKTVHALPQGDQRWNC